MPRSGRHDGSRPHQNRRFYRLAVSQCAGSNAEGKQMNLEREGRVLVVAGATNGIGLVRLHVGTPL
jgi:hypothetical protein